MTRDPTLRWSAPTAAGPIDAVVRLPGSKSMTNRALLIAALAEGTSRIRGPLRSRDTELMAGGLRALGATLSDDGADWLVEGQAGPLEPTADRVDVGNAGTVARFLPALAALAVRPVTFDGDARMRERPLGELLAALTAIGVLLDSDGGRVPVTVQGTGRVEGGAVTLDASQSSQLVSGLLLAAPRFVHGLDLRHVGRPMPSRPHVDMTVAMMREAGAEIAVAPDEWLVAPSSYRAGDVTIEPDLSGASAFVAAAVVTGGIVRVPGWPRATTQPGARLPALLTLMGAQTSYADGSLEVRGPDRPRGLTADLSDCGELLPAIAVVAALADGPSRLSGVAHLRLQETDRLAALAREINALGGEVRERPDGLEIEPRPLRGGVMATYDDHRLAMAAALLGLVVPGIEVEDVATTAKTMPDFVDRWDAMLQRD